MNPKRRQRRHKRYASNRIRRKNKPSHRRRRHNVYAMNPVRRRRSRGFARARRHSYRRNPPRVQSLLTDTAYAGLGYVGTKFAVGAVLPAIGISASPSLTSILAKGAVAYVVAWGGEKVLGGSTFMPLFLGGVATVIQDVVTLYLAPSFPGLAGGSLSAYYRPALSVQPRRALPAPGVGSYYGELSAEDML